MTELEMIDSVALRLERFRDEIREIGDDPQELLDPDERVHLRAIADVLGYFLRNSSLARFTLAGAELGGGALMWTKYWRASQRRRDESRLGIEAWRPRTVSRSGFRFLLRRFSNAKVRSFGRDGRGSRPRPGGRGPRMSRRYLGDGSRSTLCEVALLRLRDGRTINGDVYGRVADAGGRLSEFSVEAIAPQRGQ